MTDTKPPEEDNSAKDTEETAGGATAEDTPTTTAESTPHSMQNRPQQFIAFLDDLDNEKRAEHDKIRMSVSSLKGRITRFENQIQDREQRKVNCTKEIRDDYLTRLHSLRQSILERNDDYFDWLEEHGQTRDKEGGSREFNAYQYSARIEEQEEKIEELYERSEKGPKRSVRFEDDEESDDPEPSQGINTASFRQPFQSISTMTTSTARMSIQDPSQFSYSSRPQASESMYLGTRPKTGQFSYVSEAEKKVQENISTLFGQGASRSLQVSGTSTSGGASWSPSNPGNMGTSASGGASWSLPQQDNTGTSNLGRAFRPLSGTPPMSATGFNASQMQTPGTSSGATSPTEPNPLGTMSTPPTPGWPWEGDNGPDVRRQPRTPYEEILEYTKKNTSFMPNPRVPGLSREEQRHFDSIT